MWVSFFHSRVNQSSPVLLDDPVLCAMAKKYKQTPALIAFRYLLQRGLVVLAKSFKEERIKENMQVLRGAVDIRAPTQNLLHVYVFSSSQDIFVPSQFT